MTAQSPYSAPPGGAFRSPMVRFRGHLIALLSTTMVMFHLYTGAFGSFPDLIQRSLHVGGTLILAFCLYDMRRGSARDTPLGLLDAIFILSTVVVIGHLILSYDRIMGFTFRMTQLDFAFAIIATLLVLEGCRRVIGWTIPALGIAGLTYALAGPNLPGPLAHGGLDPRFAAEVLYISTRGLFGMVTGISATVIAMFVIFGAVLLRTGGGQTFMDLAMVIGGRTTGGGAKVATISSAMFGSVSGSAAANVATTGAFTIPLMKKLGYRPTFAGAVESVASTGGQIMPPIMGAGAFIMAELIGISYLTIMVAAIIPAVLYFAGCLAGIHFESKRLGYKPMTSDELPRAKDVLTLRRAGPVFLSLGTLITLLVRGFSPAMAAFTATAILVVLFLLGTRSWSDLKRRLNNLREGCIDAGIGLVAIAVLIAGAQILLAMISTTGMGVTFTSAIIGLGENHLFISLLLAMIVAMLLGTGLPTAAAYMLAAAVVAPALVRLGVEPIAAHMFIFYFSIISGLTPPLCATVFISASMAKANWLPTSITAIRLSLVAFIIPFVFVFHPEILMIGDGLTIAAYAITGLIGVTLIGAAMSGFLLYPLVHWERLMFSLAAFGLIAPGLLLPVTGGTLLLLMLAIHIMRGKASYQMTKETT
ncbi:TRAP transporter fused permease subunit [Halomonas sp. ML-15]|uniref:TRAP transporter permease n=1 Tax=Halomonas sp. ML-15 TaxID=2773305 RepID=UPI0017467F63|nr:TRAP transporter fused permease subunit [Halomonas sp. ML-15]MBD3894504.1 TRAP transporter fused permease subunit [Halomonas sp. ML-15]